MQVGKTTKDLFDSERPTGDLVCTYRDWRAPLSDGTILTGCISNYIVVRRLGVAYCELYMPIEDPNRCAGIIAGLLEPLRADPQLLLPLSLRNNTILIRKNDQDVPIKYNQLPILATFTVFVAARLSIEVKEYLVKLWSSRGWELNIRDQNYVDANEEQLRPHAFISHDSRDKDAIARPLAAQLRERVGTVWFDEYSLRVGDSLRESIENGLKQSNRCILILSKAFLQNEGWAKREFDSIYTREILEKQKVILPVWVDVTATELYQYSPILADRVGVQWSKGLAQVVESLAASLKARPS